MSAAILLTCDYPFEYGTCAHRITLDATSVVIAREQAARSGWTSRGHGDVCPFHITWRNA